MNKKLKCLLSAVMVLIMLLSAVIVMPATAAQSDDTAAETAPAATESVADAKPDETLADEESSAESEPGDVFADAHDELQEEPATEEATSDSLEAEEAALPEEVAADEETVPEKKSAELAETGVIPELKVDVNAHRDNAYNNRIVLKWDNLAAAEGYRIYWRDMATADAPKKLLTTVKGKNTLTVNNLKQGSKYRFYVVPFAEDGGKTSYGLSSNVTIATYPKPVTSFTLKSNDTNATVLKWKRVYYIDGYLILRQYQGKWTPYKYLKGNVTEFKDKNVKPGYAYYYKIMTYRKDTRGYVRSSAAQIKTLCGLSAPANNGTTSRVNRGIFSWTKNRYATAYQISYSLDNKKYKSLGNTAKTSFTTGKFKTGTTVYLRVRPYRIVGKAKTKILGMTKTLNTKIVANKFGASVGDTYIEIDISEQHLWYIIDNDVFVSTPVVTGNNNSSDTPTGTYYINNKARSVSLVGADYVSYVDYWMAFIGSSYGIHDASWRSSFGGDIYKGNGSHGCVNTPYDAVKKIYNNVSVGTPVVIHG